jgi:hypothetical protein
MMARARRRRWDVWQKSRGARGILEGDQGRPPSRCSTTFTCRQFYRQAAGIIHVFQEFTVGKSISGTPVYEIKATNPNSIANFDPGKLTKAIGENLIDYVGKPMQGLVVKAMDAKNVVEKVKKDLVAKKIEQPWLRAGISGSDMIFLVTDLKGSYEQSCVLVAGYVPLREKLKKEAGMVVNLDKGDKVIDRAAKDMGKAMNTKAVTEKEAKFAGISGSTPIVLLAHGDEDKTASGQIYGKDFAGKQPADIVKLLLDNRDEKKRLSPEYSGTIYLDGCFTAQGGAMQNYTKQVWDLLKARGVKNVKVKGNLGLAATTSKGDEIITTTEAENQAKKLGTQADAAFGKAIAKQDAKLEEIWKAKYAKKNDEKGYLADPDVKNLHAEMDGIRKTYAAKLEAELKKIPGYQVKNMVGTFGLQRLN